MAIKILRNMRQVGSLLGVRTTDSAGGMQRGCGTARRSRDSRLDAVEVGAVVHRGHVWTGIGELIDSTERALAAAEAELRQLAASPVNVGNTLHAENAEVINTGRRWVGDMRKLLDAAQALANGSDDDLEEHRRKGPDLAERGTQDGGDWAERSRAATVAGVAAIRAGNEALWNNGKPTKDSAPRPARTEQERHEQRLRAINEANRAFYSARGAV